MSYFKRFLNIESLFIISAIVFIFAWSLNPLYDPDMFFHIKNGEYIWLNGIAKYDSYSMHDKLIYIQHEWLSDIIFYLVYRIRGFESLFAFKMVIFYLWFITCYLLNMTFTGGKKGLSIVSAMISSFFISSYITIRPQIFSYELLMLETLILEKYSRTKDSRYLFVLPILALAFINLHGAVAPIFFIPIIFYATSSIFYFEYIENGVDLRFSSQNKNMLIRLLVTSIISFLIMLINPNNIKTILYSFTAFSNISLMKYIDEMQPLNIRNPFGLIIFGIFAIIVMIILFGRRPITLKQFLFIGFGFLSALFAKRSIPYFIIFSIPFFVQYMSSLKVKLIIMNKAKKSSWWISNFIRFISYGLLLVALVILILRIKTEKLQTTNFEQYPIGAISILQKEGNIRLFNDFDIGHFLIFNNIKVFIDGRAEMYFKGYNNTEVYSDLEKVYTGQVWPKDIFDKYHFTHFIVRKNSVPAMFLQHDRNYEKIYEDKNYVLFKTNLT